MKISKHDKIDELKSMKCKKKTKKKNGTVKNTLTYKKTGLCKVVIVF